MGLTSGSLNITGNSILNGFVTAGSLNVTGDSILNGNVTVGSLFITGSSLINGNVNVSGSSIINVGITSGSINITGDSILNGNVTTGALTVTGASQLNTLAVTNQATIGSLMVNTVNLTPSLGDLYVEQIFNASNNVSTPTDVTGFAFSNSVVRSFEAIVSVSVIATTNQYAMFKLLGIQKASNWYINVSYVGDSVTGISFSITSSGQIQYTSMNLPGFVSSTLKYRGFITTSV